MLAKLHSHMPFYLLEYNSFLNRSRVDIIPDTPEYERGKNRDYTGIYKHRKEFSE